jgi:hypothetical protein
MDRWGGAPAVKLMAIARNLANRMTIDRVGNPGRAEKNPVYDRCRR